MNKQTFLASLREALQGLPQAELEQTLQYYSEMIDDRMEDGASEEDAVASIGSIDAIAAQSREAAASQKKSRKRELKGWHIALLIIGAPVWGSLLAGIISLVAGLAAGAIALLAGLYAAAISTGAAAVGGLGLTVHFFIKGALWPALAWLGAGVFCAGCTFLLFPATNALLRLMIRLIKKGFRALKARFSKKGDAQ